jgi:hypothetical protein
MARKSGEAAQKYGLMKTTRRVSAFKCEVEGDEEFESLLSIAPVVGSTFKSNRKV